MPRVLIVFIALTISVSSQAQTAHESVISLNEKYKPLFGKELSTLSINFVRSFSLDGQAKDTVYYLSIKVNQRTASVEGYTLGASIFGTQGLMGGSGSGSKSYSYNRDEGSITMDYEEFKSLYEAINKVYQYLSTLKSVKKPDNNSLANYTVRDITLAGEYRAGYDSKEIYYFKLGDASFTMQELEFIDIVKVIRSIKDEWDQVEDRA